MKSGSTNFSWRGGREGYDKFDRNSTTLSSPMLFDKETLLCPHMVFCP
jgi:hypothetical protein